MLDLSTSRSRAVDQKLASKTSAESRPAGTGGTTGVGQRKVGVIDIGSNSVRLVVYDGEQRVPLAVFNEKVLCGLGRHIATTGRLDEDAQDMALVTLRRFAALIREMDVERVEMVATAAVREADNGTEFIDRVVATTAMPVRVLSGEDEARYAAAGVLSAMPEASGLVGDLGGGSLELVCVDDGATSDWATLPLGSLRLADMAGNDLGAAAKMVDEALAELPWLNDCKGRALYLVGGAWRSLANLHMVQTGHPLRILHRYTMRRKAMADMTRAVSRMSRASLERAPNVSKKRLEALPLAALVLNRVLRVAKPEWLVASGYGLREGLLFSHLDPVTRATDPLISVCRTLAAKMGRFPEHGDELMSWIAPLFEDRPYERLRLAACLLSDIGWRTHRAYRAEQAVLAILRGSFMGTDHPGRALLGLAIWVRYGGAKEGNENFNVFDILLDNEQRGIAEIMGLALRLGNRLSGGVPGLLGGTCLVVSEDELILRLTVDRGPLQGEAVEKHLQALGRALSLGTRIEVVEEL
jgi:exopolyphosphatase/guanosine-5'-triphosphate,3'-diphosphate pyrophosphatase